MNYIENLLVTASEECAEIQQDISKALRFGIGNTHHDEPDVTNGMRIIEEYIQLKAIIEKMQREDILPTVDLETEMALKREKNYKVNDYQTISRMWGRLED